MSCRRRAALLALALLAAGTTTACSGGAPSRAAATVSGPAYRNPVYDDNFPDPGVLRVGDTYYAYGTNGHGANVPVLTSKDLVHWTPHADALPSLGAWASTGNTWAPEVIALGSRYQLYYVARATAQGVQCIGRAVATNPLGPFVDTGSEPLVCQASLGGSIDPDPALDAQGKPYLYWKNDGNCCNHSVWLYGQALSADGSRLTGEPQRLLTNAKPWQGILVEAPEMVLHDGHYTLFYSANAFDTDHYAIGYASCDGPLGPCHDRSERPLVASDADAAGPGHCFVIRTPSGATWLLFHAWDPHAIGSLMPGRELWLEPLTWHGDVPVVPAPSAAEQPAPALG